MSNNIKILLQVRSNSTRLPQKCFLNIKNIPSILYLYKRIGMYAKYTTVLTTNDKSDAYLRYVLKKNKIKFYQGSSKNVLQRFKSSTSNLSNDKLIIRLTGDNLLMDSNIIKKCINCFLKQNNEYSYINSKKNNIPYGISLELFKVKLLRETNIKSKYLKEHVTSHIKHKNIFNIFNVFKNKKMYQLRCTLDYIEDYNFLKKYLDQIPTRINWKLICDKLKKYKINKKNKFFFEVKKTYELTKSEHIKIFNLKNTFWKYGLESQKEFFQKMYKKNDLHILFFNNSNLIGYNCLKILNSSYFKYILIDSFIIDPDYQGKGISDILLSKSLNEIINLNYITYLYANSNSLSLYKRFGFQKTKHKLFEKKNKRYLMRFIK
jgi:spore coat polysaccharide biosynthesis protein SpsF (cytidylyltransferase family)/predicted GNAT family N-acyltransferase|tara:strand:- start:32194 stop:33324 length:1131 start_codon:yes stop_codon:yes gene_type:complete